MTDAKKLAEMILRSRPILSQDVYALADKVLSDSFYIEKRGVYLTRAGDTVTIFGKDSDDCDAFPIVGYFGECFRRTDSWREDGHFYGDEEDGSDIVKYVGPIPEEF